MRHHCTNGRGAGLALLLAALLDGMQLRLVDCSSSSSSSSGEHVLDFDAIIDGLPPGFVFGTASAAYQIEGAVNEGGRGPTIWDTFSHMDPPKVARGENGDVACDSYHRYEEDADLTKAAGFDGFRMSFAWSRIYPEGEGDEPNAEGIQHYHDVIDSLLERGLEPVVTLYHWDLPQALEDKYGGWLNESIVPAFDAYADTCFREYGGKVKKWITINEPWSFIHHGYSTGGHAPGRCSNRTHCDEGDSFTEPYIAGHNVLNSHAKAVSTYRTKYKAEQRGIIGMTLNSDWAAPLDPDSDADKATAERFMEFQLAWWADPIYFGDYPQVMKDVVGDRLPVFTEEESALIAGSNDFFGLNHYTSWYYTDIPDEDPPREGTSPAKARAAGITLPETPPGDGWSMDIGAIQTKMDLNGKMNGGAAATDWLTIAPEGFRPLLVWVASRYGRPIIFITENGVDRAGEDEMELEEALKDEARQLYYHGYITSMVTAMVEDAIDVRGYYAWSILDNFEWSDGYRPRFGLTFVDYDNGQARYPKDSSKWFASLAEARRERRDGNITAGCDCTSPSSSSSSSSSSSDDDSDGDSDDDSDDDFGGEAASFGEEDGAADVQMAAGEGGQQMEGGGGPHGLQHAGRASGGLVLLCLLVAAAVGAVGFSLGKYSRWACGRSARYEGLAELPRSKGWWVAAFLCSGFVAGATCSVLLLRS